MSEDTYSAFMQLLKDDPRFRMEAYQFVREALSFGQRFQQDADDELADEEDLEDLDLECFEDEDDDDDEIESWEEEEEAESHLTGQVLCQAIRQYATQQYGLLAKVVLNSWGIHTTSDFGEIVYNLISINMMKKSKSDRREDFDDQYDFEDAFVKNFDFELSEETGSA
ncbi:MULTISPECIES: Minf_1886 family protein [Pirellulaceae]|nr:MULTISPECIES: Minf_1886 family protein [Pirellulaceae]